METKKLIALKRITKELKELAECPLEGIGITTLDNDPMKFLFNMELMMGPYQGYKVQLKMNLSEEYPVQPPKILLYPNQEINSLYHQHIYGTKQGFKQFCFDPINNNLALNGSKKYMGWKPSYTISAILLQVQNFLSDPDLPEGKLPSKEKIACLIKAMDTYKKTFYIQDENGKREIMHTWKDPYPKMHYKNQIKQKEDKKMQTIRENLTCSFLRESYLENNQLQLGYPIVKVKYEKEKEKISLFPVPELLCYEAYQIMDQSKAMMMINENYQSTEKLQEQNNEYLIRWLPIYINETHFGKSQEKMMECIKAIKGEKEFKPEQAFEILTMILKRVVMGMFKGKNNLSADFMMCYYQYLFLFKEICKKFQEKYESYLHYKKVLLKVKDYDTTEMMIPSISEFLFLSFMGKGSMAPDEIKKIKDTLILEYLSRQISWVFHGPQNEKIKEKIISEMWIDDEIFFERFQKDRNFEMKYHKRFNENLHKWNLYKNVINIITNDYDYLYQYYNDKLSARLMAEEKIKYNFKGLLNDCGKWGKSKLKTLILKSMHFKNYFDVDEDKLKEQLYQECKVDEIMRKNVNKAGELLRLAFKSQKGNQLLIITFLTLKKAEEKGLCEEQEKNLGIYTKMEEVMNEIKEKTKEVQSYKDLCECLDTELGKEKDELGIVTEAYQRAKTKGYM